MQSVLAVRNLTFAYADNKPIYRDFEIEVGMGELVCLVGPSGSGKSTLFELITRTLRSQKGTIIAERTAQIYQDPYSSFHPTYSILSQLKDAIGALDEDEVRGVCARLSLDEALLHQKPHKLSGGELQRCSILRAILMKPKLLLADEPTSALDSVTQLEVLRHLIEMLGECGCLLITHDRALANWCADRIVDLERL
jgi:peptide/nickel transport system ATP-binding protein